MRIPVANSNESGAIGVGIRMIVMQGPRQIYGLRTIEYYDARFFKGYDGGSCYFSGSYSTLYPQACTLGLIIT